MDPAIETTPHENESGSSPSRVDSYVNKYRSLLKKSGSSIIEQAKMIYEVEGELGDKYTAAFYEKVGLQRNGATVRKLRIIGENFTRFQPYLEKIPNTWTTLYDLARLSTDEFKKVVDAELLTPFVTAQEIRTLLRGRPPQDTTPRRRARVSIDLAAANDGKGLFAEITKLTKQFGVELFIDSEAKKQFASTSGISK